MINRVTESIKFNMITNSMFTIQSDYGKLMEKLSTQKMINRPSDDPIGTNDILNYRTLINAIQQYQTNITDADISLSVAETALSSIKKLAGDAASIAISEASTGSAETMDISAATVSALIDEAVSLMNVKNGDSYLFGGSRTDIAPFSAASVGSYGVPTAAPVNDFDGTVTSGGIYTGATDKTYLVDITAAGTVASGSIRYRYSTDNGASWTTDQIVASDGTTALGADGANLTFTEGAVMIAVGDRFSVNTAAANIANATMLPANTFDGAVTSSGTYTATTDKTYLVDITTADTVASGSIRYRYSTDNGASWTTDQIVASDGTTALGTDGANLTFTEGATMIAVGDRFSVNATAAGIENTITIPVNAFDGTVTSSGTYTGTDNKTYALRIISGGPLAAATYQISADGGITWGSTQTGLSSQINLGDGIKMTFTAGSHNLAANDSFTVSTIATGFDNASASSTNTFNGTVTSAGTYTGTQNKTYAVKISADGPLATTTYQVSQDGGKTWNSESNFPAQEVKAAVAKTAGSLPITASTIWHEIDGAIVKDGTAIAITGTDHDGNPVGGLPTDTYIITNAATGTVQDLLDKIEATFSGAVTATIDTAGKITVTDNMTGASNLALTLTITNPSGGTLALGTFNATQAKTIELGDGVTATFTPGTLDLKANDVFTVNAYAAGFYRGNNDSISVQIGKGNSLAYNITGSSAFTAENGGVDLIAALYALKDALSSHDTDLVSAQNEQLQNLQTQVLQAETLSGAKRSSLELASSNHKSLDLQITNRLADVENADLTELITEFQMKQIAMQASYSMASKIGEMTIMNYL
ncbi:MAG: hypothetical protein CVU72_00100 [Deltaproteobacteria bacterium HGW-Deltaproteobacteria-7]|nr:MAG: hypothetical protein CVU72_00100 [Deltaproteobacteria bacterium HGW-Deltaproteobacteria-7]PKN20762.1 MAG: hypothetical protein CVU71_03000 [Deltaproteobacteria bacterium HGW-Deltaproteobacteria-6]